MPSNFNCHIVPGPSNNKVKFHLNSSCQLALSPSNNKVIAKRHRVLLLWPLFNFDHQSRWNPLTGHTRPGPSMRPPTSSPTAKMPVVWAGSAGQGHPSPIPGAHVTLTYTDFRRKMHKLTSEPLSAIFPRHHSCCILPLKYTLRGNSRGRHLSYLSQLASRMVPRVTYVSGLAYFYNICGHCLAA